MNHITTSRPRTSIEAGAIEPFGRRFEAPGPVPLTVPLRTFSLLRRLRENPVATWTRRHFDEPVLSGESILGRIMVVSDPELIRQVLVDRVATYPKDKLQHRVLSSGLGRGLLLSSSPLLALAFGAGQGKEVVLLLALLLHERGAGWQVGLDLPQLELWHTSRAVLRDCAERGLGDGGRARAEAREVVDERSAVLNLPPEGRQTCLLEQLLVLLLPLRLLVERPKLVYRVSRLLQQLLSLPQIPPRLLSGRGIAIRPPPQPPDRLPVNLRRSAKVSDLDQDGLEVVVPCLGAHEEDNLARPAWVVGVVGIVLIFCRLGLPREDRAVSANRIDLPEVERRLHDRKRVLQFSHR